MDNKKIWLSKQQRKSYGLTISCLYISLPKIWHYKSCLNYFIMSRFLLFNYSLTYIVQIKNLKIGHTCTYQYCFWEFITNLLSKRYLHIFVLHFKLNAAWETFFKYNPVWIGRDMSDTLNLMCIKKWSNEIHVQVEVKHIFFLLEKWSVS